MGVLHHLVEMLVLTDKVVELEVHKLILVLLYNKAGTSTQVALEMLSSMV